jgi:hypothetical protein
VTETATTSIPSFLESLEPIIANVVAPAAVEIDQRGAFPRLRFAVTKPLGVFVRS